MFINICLRTLNVFFYLTTRNFYKNLFIWTKNILFFYLITRNFLQQNIQSKKILAKAAAVPQDSPWRPAWTSWAGRRCRSPSRGPWSCRSRSRRGTFRTRRRRALRWLRLRCWTRIPWRREGSQSSKVFDIKARTTVSQDVQTWFSVQLAFAKFLSKIKEIFNIVPVSWIQHSLRNFP